MKIEDSCHEMCVTLKFYIKWDIICIFHKYPWVHIIWHQSATGLMVATAGYRQPSNTLMLHDSEMYSSTYSRDCCSHHKNWQMLRDLAEVRSLKATTSGRDITHIKLPLGFVYSALFLPCLHILSSIKQVFYNSMYVLSENEYRITLNRRTLREGKN